MTKRFKTCILHIGTEKTGTSTVQSFLNLNRNNLIKDGILFPVTTLTQQGSQWEFVAAIHNTPWTMDIGEACGISNEQDQRIFRQSFTKDLNRQFSQCVHADTLLISSEHFHSRLSTEQMISDLKTFLLPWVDSFKIIVYFRRQDELSMSYYSTRIKSGEPKTSLLLPQSGPEKRYFDFIWIYKSWAKYFGKDAIFARLYQRNKQGNYGILEDFCNLCNISLNGKIMPLWLNTSLNAKGLALVNAMHRYFKENRRYVSESLFQQILYEISNEFSGKFYPASREQAQLFYSQFQKDNDCLRALAFPTYLDPLFNTDFSAYPVEPDQLVDPSVRTIEAYIDKVYTKDRKNTVTRFLQRSSRLLSSVVKRDTDNK